LTYYTFPFFVAGLTRPRLKPARASHLKAHQITGQKLRFKASNDFSTKHFHQQDDVAEERQNSLL
jgi:hypothetical protein